MNVHTDSDVTPHIIEKAKEFGASLAGITSVVSLKNSPSYTIYDKSPYCDGYDKVEWPVDAKSVLVLALLHDPSEPELDWWDYQPGRTRGNRQLISIAKSLKGWMDEELSINARSLPYRVEEGGYSSRMQRRWRDWVSSLNIIY